MTEIIPYKDFDKKRVKELGMITITSDIYTELIYRNSILCTAIERELGDDVYCLTGKEVVSILVPLYDDLYEKIIHAMRIQMKKKPGQPVTRV